MMQKTAVPTTAPTMTGVWDLETVDPTLEAGEDASEEVESGTEDVGIVEAGELADVVLDGVRVKDIETDSGVSGIKNVAFQGKPPKAATETAAGQRL